MHVDDGLVVSNSPKALEELRLRLTSHLEVKWKMSVDQIVGINIHQLAQKVFLEQHLLATQFVNTYHRCAIHQNTSLPDSPLTTSIPPPIDSTRFCSVLGSLRYLAAGTRPDIAFTVNLLARHSNSPSEPHWEALDHLVG